MAHLYDDFQDRVKAGQEKGKAMDELGIKRYCCRALFLGHVDLLDTVSQFKKF